MPPPTSRGIPGWSGGSGRLLSAGGRGDPSQRGGPARGRGPLPGAGQAAARSGPARVTFGACYPDTISRTEARAAFGHPRERPGGRLLRPGPRIQGRAPPRAHRPRRSHRRGDVILLVAGAPHPPALADEVRAAAGGDPRVRLSLEHVPDAGRAALPPGGRPRGAAVPGHHQLRQRAAGARRSTGRSWFPPAAPWASSRRSPAPTGCARTRDELTPDLLASALDWAVAAERSRPRASRRSTGR